MAIWSRAAPRPLHKASIWNGMGLQIFKSHRIISVQTRCFTVSIDSWYDSFHVNSVAFLESSQGDAVKDESDGTNGGKYVIMLRDFWSCLCVSSIGMLCTALTLAASGCDPILSLQIQRRS